MIDIQTVEKGQVLKVATRVDASNRADFQVLKVQEKIHRKRRLTTKRVGRDSLAILDDSEAYKHNFAEHEKARRAMALRRVLMESIDLDSLTDSERAEYKRFLASQVRDLAAIIAVRTREAMADKKQRGELVGSVPLGYRLAADGVHLEENTEEQAILAEIRSLAGAGLSTRKIAAKLNDNGHRNRTGGEWSFVRVAQILRSISIQERRCA